MPLPNQKILQKAWIQGLPNEATEQRREEPGTGPEPRRCSAFADSVPPPLGSISGLRLHLGYTFQTNCSCVQTGQLPAKAYRHSPNLVSLALVTQVKSASLYDAAARFPTNHKSLNRLPSVSASILGFPCSATLPESITMTLSKSMTISSR